MARKDGIPLEIREYRSLVFSEEERSKVDVVVEKQDKKARLSYQHRVTFVKKKLCSKLYIYAT